MSKALIAGINQVATDKGLDREVIFEAIEAALVSAYKRNYGSVANVEAEVDRVTGEMRVFAEREVVEDVINERTEISQEDATAAHPNVKLGDVINVQSTPTDFGRIAAQTAKQVILQRIREAERDTVYENFAHRVGELINGQVRSVDQVSGAVTVLLNEKHECLLLRDEQIPAEKIRRGDYIKVYVVDVHRSTRGPVIKLSRSHRNLLRRLMEQEIPEVRDGVVEIKAIAREPGARSKVAVVATEPGVDAVGSCVGMRGLRIQNIVNELSGEKIDVVEWSTDLATYISNALSPAKVNNVILEESGSVKTAVVVVPDRQLSLAIGKEGQNARLAAKLTGWRIDIKSESEAVEEGLDRMSQAQLQTFSSTPSGKIDDLDSVVARILQGDDESRVPTTTGDDIFAQAARALEAEDKTSALADEVTADLPSFDDALAAAESDFQVPSDLPALPDLDELPAMPVLPDEELAAEEVEEAEPVLDQEPTADLAAVEPELAVEAAVQDEEENKALLGGDELPDVITADMLRARMAQRKEIDFNSPDFEIPAELLEGLEVEDEWDDLEEEELPRGKRGKADKVDKKAKKKKRRPASTDDDGGFGYR